MVQRQSLRSEVTIICEIHIFLYFLIVCCFQFLCSPQNYILVSKEVGLIVEFVIQVRVSCCVCVGVLLQVKCCVVAVMNLGW